MPITTTDQKVNLKGFNENFDSIFGPAKKVKGGRWIYDKVKGELVPADEYCFPSSAQLGPTILKPLEPFISPVTRELITDRGQLRRHNAEHGVTDARDYSPEYIEKRAKQRIDEGQEYLKRTRREDLNRAFDEHTR